MFYEKNPPEFPPPSEKKDVFLIIWGEITEKLYIKRQLFFSSFLILYTKNVIHFPLKIIFLFTKS